MWKKTYAIHYVAGQPVKRVFSSTKEPQWERVLSSSGPLSHNSTIKILVWNIFKQQRSEWMSVLKKISKGTHLVLLQEAYATPELIKFATSNYLAADQVPAFVLPQHPSGVMTLSLTYPIYCCPLREREPLLRLSKSALITTYPLLSKQILMVVNIHAVNFSLGIDVYSKQLSHIREQLQKHFGPVVMAGDFNAWSNQRIKLLYKFSHEMMLGEVIFTNDYRRKAFGRPLDFVFYRDMKVVSASVLITRASDHNPILVEFNSSYIVED